MIHEIRSYMIGKLNDIRTNDHSAAMLAQLRRGVGHAPGDQPQLWSLLFDGMPEQMLSRNGVPTRAEWAVHTALTLYAVHQQSKDLQQGNMHQEGQPLGEALNKLAGGDAEAVKRIKRRFDAMATADHMPELVYHLRGLVQLLRAGEVALDYEQLAVDLYNMQNPQEAPGIRLRWGQDFYDRRKQSDDNA